MKIAIIFSVLLLSGCATISETKEWSAIGGSKSDGSVKLAYPIALFNNSAPMYSGLPLAAKRCKAWGYRGASEFGGHTVQCESRNGFGDCLRGNVVKEYQCIG